VGEGSEENWDASPIALPRLAHEVWQQIRKHDWVLTAGTLDEWARIVWTSTSLPASGQNRSAPRPDRISLGVALAHRGKGRLVVDLQPDGDLMFDAGSLWGRGQAPHPDAGRDVQQPRLLQRLGAPDPHGPSCAARRSSAPTSAWTCPIPSRLRTLARSMGWYAEGRSTSLGRRRGAEASDSQGAGGAARADRHDYAKAMTIP